MSADNQSGNGLGVPRSSTETLAKDLMQIEGHEMLRDWSASRLVLYATPLRLEEQAATIASQTAQIEALEARMKRESASLREASDVLGCVIEWHGGMHEADCPQDDTCDCCHKALNDRVNEVLK